MLIYLLAGLVVLAVVLLCAKDWIIEEVKHPSSDALMGVIAMAGIYILWPVFAAYIIIEIYKGR